MEEKKDLYRKTFEVDLTIFMLDQLIMMNRSRMRATEREENKSLNKKMDTILEATGMIAMITMPVSLFLLIWFCDNN